MPLINCLLNIKNPILSKKIGERIPLDAEGNPTMSEAQQREEGKKIALEFHKELHNELNKFKTKIGKQPEKYSSPEQSDKVKEITNHYNKLIEDKKTEFINSKKPLNPNPNEVKTNTQESISKEGNNQETVQEKNVQQNGQGQGRNVNEQSNLLTTNNQDNGKEPKTQANNEGSNRQEKQSTSVSNDKGKELLNNPTPTTSGKVVSTEKVLTTTDALDSKIKKVEDTPTGDNFTEDDKKSYLELLQKQKELLTTNNQENAVQIKSAGEVLQREQKTTGKKGSERNRVESNVKREKVTEQGKKEEVSKPLTTNERIRDYIRKNHDTGLLGKDEPLGEFIHQLLSQRVVIKADSLKEIYPDLKEGVESPEFTARKWMTDANSLNFRKGIPKAKSIEAVSEELATTVNTHNEKHDQQNILNTILDAIHSHGSRNSYADTYQGLMEKALGREKNTYHTEQEYADNTFLEDKKGDEQAHEAVDILNETNLEISDNEILDLYNKYLDTETGKIDAEKAFNELPTNIFEQLIKYTDEVTSQAINRPTENQNNEVGTNKPSTETQGEKTTKGSLEKELDGKLLELQDKVIELQKKYVNKKYELSKRIGLFGILGEDNKLVDNGVSLTDAQKEANSQLQEIQDEIDKTKNELTTLEKTRPDVIEADKKQLDMFVDKTENHQIYYNGKVVDMGYVPNLKEQFKRAGQRIADNLGTGVHKEDAGYIKTPDGKIYEVSRTNKTAKLLSGDKLTEAQLKFKPTLTTEGKNILPTTPSSGNENIDIKLKELEDKFNKHLKAIEDAKKGNEGNVPPPVEKVGNTEEKPLAEGIHINKEDISTKNEIGEKFPLQGNEVKWKESVNKGIETLSKEAKKGETLFDVADRKIWEWNRQIDNELRNTGKSTFNPSDEDLAIMAFARTKLNEQLSNLTDALNSGNQIERVAALSDALLIQNRILDVDYVLSESGKVAGRSFYIRQMVSKMDSENSLNIRRMEVMRNQNGEKLSSEQEMAINKVNAEEQKLHKDYEKNIPKFSQEDFDAKVKQEVDKIIKEQKENKKNVSKITESKREKTLKQTGEDWANKILKAKIKVNNNSLQTNILALPVGIYNSLVESVAALVRGGATIADAISGVLKDSRFSHIDEKELINHLIGEVDKQDIISEIKNLSKEEESKNLTLSAVGKGLVNDLVNTYIGQGLRGKEVFDTLNKDLKELYPNISEQQVRDAYLKTGDYKLENSKTIDKEKLNAQSELKNIAKLETSLENARKGIADAKTETQKRTATEIEAKLKKELDKELKKQNIPIERGSKTTIDIKKKSAEAHNERMDLLSKELEDKLNNEAISDEDKIALNKAKNIIDLSKVDTKTSERIDNALEKAKQKLQEANIELVGSKHEDILHEISKSIADINLSNSEAEQDILLANYKKSLENRIKAAQDKIDNNEFDDSKPPLRTKTDAEAIRLEIEARKIEGKYRILQDLASQKDKSIFQKSLRFAQSFLVNELIGGLHTEAVVAISGLTKQPLNTITNLTFGSAAHFMNPELSKRAGAEAPISFNQEFHRYKAHYGSLGEKGAAEIWDRLKNNLTKAQNEFEVVKNNYKKDTNKYKEAESKYTQALIAHQANFIYDWLGHSAWKDSSDVFLKRASQLDELIGKSEKIGWKQMTNLEKTEMVMGVMGATHGYLKNFSARAEFAASFVARLENKARNGIDISTSDEILKTVNESFVNYLMGKYQEDNYATTAMKRIGKVLEETGLEPSRQGADRRPKNELLGKAAASLYKGQYPIIRTGVNIAREAIQEYLLGAFWGGTIHAGVQIKGIFNGIKESEPIRESINKAIQKMSPDQADLIFRCYRKGGLGLVMMGLAAYGYIKFGGFYDKDDKSRKKGQLKQGDITLFDHYYDSHSIVAKMFAHTAALYPALMIANYRDVKERKLSQPSTKDDAVSKALISDLNGALNTIPVLNNQGMSSITNPSIPYGRAAADIQRYYDTDAKGNQIERDKSTWMNRLKINTGFGNYVPVKKEK